MGAAVGVGLARRLGPTAALGAVLLLALALLTPSESEVGELPASARSPRPAGAKALYLFLSKLGFEVRRWEQPDYVDLPDGTLWMLTYRPVSRLKLEPLAEFVARGNVVIGTTKALAPLLEREGIEHLRAGTRAPAGAEAQGLSYQLSVDEPRELSATPPPQRIFAELQAPKWLKGTPIVASWAAGAGAIVLLGAEELVRNDQIGLKDNGPFLLELAKAREALDGEARSDRSCNGVQMFDEG